MKVQIGDRVYISGTFDVGEIQTDKRGTYVSGWTEGGMMIRVPVEYVEKLGKGEERVISNGGEE